MSETRVSFERAEFLDWATFHDACAHKFGFFTGYGRNKDAWFDCMCDPSPQLGPLGTGSSGAYVLIEVPIAAEEIGEAKEIAEFIRMAMPEVNGVRLNAGHQPFVLAEQPISGGRP